MASKNPIQKVKDKFGDKDGLVKAVEAFTTDDLWIARTNKDKGLKHVSNSKLLRLHAIFTEVKERFGTRAKLVDAVLDLVKRGKDDGYRAALSKYPVPRLYDLYRSTAKRTGATKDGAPKGEPKAKAAKAADKKVAAATPAKPAPAKKAAAAEAAPAKKPAAKKKADKA